MRGLVVLVLACLAFAARADVFRPAYLELREAGEGRYDVMWKVPAQGGARLALEVIFPADTTKVAPSRNLLAGDAYVEQWQISRPGGLVGQTVAIDGIAGGVTDVIVRVERSDGTSQVEHLLPQRPEFTVNGASGTAQVAGSYLVLGIEHILSGFDHLLFVLALLLIVRGGRRIVATITAFTLAHSLTLAAATLGWVNVPGPPVEATIALSIVFVAAEVVQALRGRSGSRRGRRGWWLSPSACCTGLDSRARWRRLDCPRRRYPWLCCSSTLGSKSDSGLRARFARLAGPSVRQTAKVDCQPATVLHRYGGDVLGHRTHWRVLELKARLAVGQR